MPRVAAPAAGSFRDGRFEARNPVFPVACRNLTGGIIANPGGLA
jgi:hypothetical protein